MNFLAKNIKFLRNQKRVNQQYLATQLNIQASIISNYEQKKALPPLERTMLLAKFFNVSIDDLIYTDLSINQPKNSFPSQVVPIYIKKSKSTANPLIPIKASAGYFSDFFQDEKHKVEYLNLPFFFSQNQKRTFEVEGDSMTPYFEDGDYVVCSILSNINQIVSNNYYVIASKQDGILLKKIISDRERQHYLLISENKNYSPIIRHWNEINEIWEVKYRITKDFK